MTTVGIAAGLAVALTLAGPAVAVPMGPPGGGGSSAFTPCDAGAAADAGTVSCSAVQLDDIAAWTGLHAPDVAATTTSPPSGYAPAQLQQAYNLTVASAADGRGRTVAIVDAYDDPYALSNLSTYRAEWRLPPICGVRATRGCVTVTKENQRGASSPLPSPDPGWSEEISVDLDTVSAVCPNCNILLVEADAATPESLGRAELTAAAAEPVSIGNSFGVSESPSEIGADWYFRHPGIAVTAAAGDDGYGVQWPAASPSVIAVGGTTLTPTSGSSRGWTEAAWSGDGSGCSAVEPQPTWQSRVRSIRALCPGRAVADVAAVSDPETGVAVYDTVDLPGWTVFGGTSVAAQIISALYGLADSDTGQVGASGLYAAAPRDFFDVTAGSDGSCGSVLCTAGVGWDGPTGLGTPDGTGAF